MNLPLRFRRPATLGAIAALGLSGCHLFGSHDDAIKPHHGAAPVLVEPAPPAPYEDAPILPPAPVPAKSASIPGSSAEPQRLPIVPPPSIPPAVDDEPVPSASRSTIRPICFEFASSSCCPTTSCCPPTTCCDPCSSSLLSKLTRPMYEAKWRMHCMKASMKRRLSSLNPFNKCRSCAPVSACCSPCDSYVSDGVVLDGMVVGEYSMPPVYSDPMMSYYSTPQPVYSYPQSYSSQPYQPMPQSSCPTCQSQSVHPMPTYSHPHPPVHGRQTYAHPPQAHGHPHPAPHHTYQQPPQPTYQPPQPIGPTPALPQPAPPIPQPAPSTTQWQPAPAPAASQVSYTSSITPGYSNPVPAVRQTLR